MIMLNYSIDGGRDLPELVAKLNSKLNPSFRYKLNIELSKSRACLEESMNLLNVCSIFLELFRSFKCVFRASSIFERITPSCMDWCLLHLGVNIFGLERKDTSFLRLWRSSVVAIRLEDVCLFMIALRRTDE
jgi:hypothetical protein